eukprot:1146868-Pelagomonas_calceolata.AAC.6
MTDEQFTEKQPKARGSAIPLSQNPLNWMHRWSFEWNTERKWGCKPAQRSSELSRSMQTKAREEELIRLHQISCCSCLPNCMDADANDSNY